MSDLSSVLSACLSDIISKYDLNLVDIGDNRALLQSAKYAIYVTADRDGVSMIYFDRDNGSLNGYNIFLFLLNNRYNLLTFSHKNEEIADYSGFIREQVESLASHLRSAGEDILSGCKKWVIDYRSPVVHVDPSVAGLIRKS